MPVSRGSEPRSFRLAALAVALCAAAPAAPATAVSGEQGWVEVTRFGALGDGISDDTAAFQRAADTGRPLRVPKPPVHYKLTRKVRLSASVVGDGSLPEIRMYGADGKEEHTIFEVWGYRGPGLVVRGLRLDGGWDGIARPGEWSHLVLIKGSRNVTIEDNVLVRPFGDCVLVGGEGHPEPSEDVLIRRNRMEQPRRCCVAVISARRLVISGNTFLKTLDYVSAIDLEPNPGHPEVVQDVEIARNTFDVPRGVAIQLYTHETIAGANGNVRVVLNTARARQFFLKGNNTGTWERLRVADNTFHGDPGGDPGERVAFVVIEQEPRFHPRVLRDVAIEGNTVRVELGARQVYEDRLLGIHGLRLVANRWLGGATYRLIAASSPQAYIAANEPDSVVRGR